MPIELRLSECAEAIEGEVLPKGAEGSFSGVTTDSREISPGMLFVARVGEESDGHKHVGEAFQAGAAACIVAKGRADQSSGPLIAVDDPDQALASLAIYWRQKLSLPTIAVTGSNGKTTTKEILRAVLQALKGPGTANIKSYNNFIGLPQTILGSSEGDKWMVLEVGMNHAGEISNLAPIAKPDVAILLNVAPVHYEFFSSLDDIADAKCELLEGLSGPAVVNADNPFLLSAIERAEKRLGKQFQQIHFGTNLEAEYRLHSTQLTEEGTCEFMFSVEGETFDVVLPLLGKHNAYNALAAIAASRVLFPELAVAEICEALKESRPAAMRLERIQVGEVTILSDCYNANPNALKGGLEVASRLGGETGFVAVLGDMLELGDESQRYHSEAGALAVEFGAKGIVTLGSFKENVAQGAREAGLENVHTVSSSEEAVQQASREESSVIFVKASRGMRLERVVEGLKRKL